MEKQVNDAREDREPVSTGCGDPEEFTLLYQRTAAGIYAYLYRLCGCRHLAEDLLQETFLTVFRSMGDFKARSSIRTWVYAIATNKFRDHCRNKRRTVEIDPDILETRPAPGPEPLEAMIRREDSLRVRQAVQTLPPELKATLLLVRFEGLKYREAAEVLGTTQATVRMQVHRAHRILARTLGAAGHGQR